jgi:hypothetical protein
MKFFRSCDCMACRVLCFLLSQAVQIELLHSAKERCDIKKTLTLHFCPIWLEVFFGYTSEFCSIRLCTWDTHEQCGRISSNLGGTPPVMPEGFLKSPQSLDTNTEKRCLDGGCNCRSWLILWPWVVLEVSSFSTSHTLKLRAELDDLMGTVVFTLCLGYTFSACWTNGIMCVLCGREVPSW